MNNQRADEMEVERRVRQIIAIRSDSFRQRSLNEQAMNITHATIVTLRDEGKSAPLKQTHSLVKRILLGG